MRFVICSAEQDLAPVASRAAPIAHWTNVASEMVDAPANVMSPAHLADRVVNFAHLDSEIVDPARAGLGALAAVCAKSDIARQTADITRGAAVAAALGRGASGYGVRVLVEPATRLSVTLTS